MDWVIYNGRGITASASAVVNYKTRSGDERTGSYVDLIRWDQGGSPGDIVAYQVVDGFVVENVTFTQSQGQSTTSLMSQTGERYNPIDTRDRIFEIDAYMAEIALERKELLEKLTVEGFNLVDVPVFDGEYRIGDLVELFSEENSCTAMNIGQRGRVTKLDDEGGDIGIDDRFLPSVKDIKFISR